MTPFTFFRMRALLLSVSGSLLAVACGGATPASEAPPASNASTPHAPDSPAPSADPAVPLADPDFAEGTINDVAFEGSYACDPGLAPEITFDDDGTTKVFRAFLDQRLFTSGTWSWDGSTLRVESTAGSFAFTDVALGDGTMVLGRGDSRWDCRYLASESP